MNSQGKLMQSIQIILGGGGIGRRPKRLNTYIERWPDTASAWAGWSRFDIQLDRFGGVHSQLICTALHWGLLHATRLASREILVEQNIKKRTGPALCVLCGADTYCTYRLEYTLLAYTYRRKSGGRHRHMWQ